ncbi:hypothetical protein CXF88_12810 [Shewanella sp. ALD9]|nr:hypothetical protein CXF88_12810 [Shewanella sp. ALD9]
MSLGVGNIIDHVLQGIQASCLSDASLAFAVLVVLWHLTHMDMGNVIMMSGTSLTLPSRHS